MKIWQFLFASGALATTPTEAQTTCFTSVTVPGATNDCVGLYGDEGTCTTTCGTSGGTIAHKCECHDTSGALLANCQWESTATGSCLVDYYRIDFDVAYTASGQTTIQATHEPLLEAYFKTIVDPAESFSVVISDFKETASSTNTAVTCKVTIRFDDAVTQYKWLDVGMYDLSASAPVNADAFDYTAVSTGLDTSLTATNIVGTSTVSYEKILASNPDAATDLLREVDAKEHVLATITEKKTEKTDQETLKTTREGEKTTLEGEINTLKSDKSTKTTTKTTLETSKTTKTGELAAAKQLVTDKQGEIDVVLG